jgi:hypothetical protein
MLLFEGDYMKCDETMYIEHLKERLKVISKERQKLEVEKAIYAEIIQSLIDEENILYAELIKMKVASGEIKI